MITQDTCDPTNPEEHFLWGLMHLPNMQNIPMVTHPEILRGWSQHLSELGFVHGPYLASLADENGFIHVSQLPTQTKKWRAPYRGSQTIYNNAAMWVDIDEPEPEKVVLPKVSSLTKEEQAAMIAQFREEGLIEEPRPEVDYASVEGES